jgi:hypothetical protein
MERLSNYQHPPSPDFVDLSLLRERFNAVSPSSEV